MKYKLNFVELLFVSFLLINGIGGCKNKEYSVIDSLLPSPQKVVFNGNVSFSAKESRDILLYSEVTVRDSIAAEDLKKEVNKLFGNKLHIQTINSYQDLPKSAIILGVPVYDSAFQKFCNNLPLLPKKNKESYAIDVNDNRIIVAGGDNPGLYYGIQTLIQLMEESKWRGNPVPGMTIQDWPEIALRAVHFDMKHHLDRFGYLKKAIKELGRYKINCIVFEFEDKFKYQSNPTVAAPNSFTPEQIKELNSYAQQNYINMIPLVQGLGHAGYILKHKKYEHLREDPESYWAFCPLKEGTYDLLFDLYRETIMATSGNKYFHVGGDEVRVMGKCSQCKKKEKKIGKLGLYLEWLERVNKYLEGKDRTMIFWDDVPLKEAGIYTYTHTETPEQKLKTVWPQGIGKLEEVIKKFPQDGVFMRWNYGSAREKGNIRILEWYGQNNFDKMIATATQTMRPLIPDYEVRLANIKSFITLGVEKEVMGELCTAWDDSDVHFANFWMGFLASGEYAWSADSPPTIVQYCHKYVRRFFGPDARNLVETFHNLSNRVDFWNTGLMKIGNKHRLYRGKKHQLIQLPSFENTPPEGNWAAHYNDRVKKASREKELCKNAVRSLEQNMEYVIRNRYNLEVYASMGRFMMEHCNLVLGIGDIATHFDRAREAYKKENKTRTISELAISATVADSVWANYIKSYQSMKKVWEKSRYPKGGKGFVPYRYQHFASQREDLSYLIMAEEKMDLPGFSENIRAVINEYQNKGTPPFKSIK